MVAEQDFVDILEKALLLDEISNEQSVFCPRLQKKAILWLRFACGAEIERGGMLKQCSKYHQVDAQQTIELLVSGIIVKVETFGDFKFSLCRQRLEIILSKMFL